MKKLIIICLLFVGCVTKKENLETKVKSYMATSYVPSMNDPKSYEFVSMEVDTVKGELADLRTMRKTLDETPDNYDKVKADLKIHPSKEDSTYYYIINTKIRGKNKMGAVILNEQKLKYSEPSTFEMVEK